MPTSIDYDKSGLSRQSSRVSLGPSIGLVDIAGDIIDITSAMTITLPVGVALVRVNVAAGSVVLTLPSAKASPAGPLAQPSSSAISDMTIVDVGGHAQSNPITIKTQPGETVAGVGSISIATAYASLTLTPDIQSGVFNAT